VRLSEAHPTDQLASFEVANGFWCSQGRPKNCIILHIMRNGIYRVEFRSGRRISPSGLVVLKDGSVNGGDDGFVYRGTYNVEGQKVTAQIGISKHNPGAQSIFGPIDKYTLALTGTTAANIFTLSGGVTGRQDLTIEIRGSRLADAS
jgi:T3SS negative regulator,GrlR